MANVTGRKPIPKWVIYGGIATVVVVVIIVSIVLLMKPADKPPADVKLPATTEVIVTFIGETTLEVDWEEVVGALQYRVVWRAGATTGVPIEVADTHFTLNNFDLVLPPDTDAIFEVMAMGALPTHTSPATKSSVFRNTYFRAPRNVTATLAANRRDVLLTWQINPTASSYLLRATTTTQTYDLGSVSGGSTSSKLLTGIQQLVPQGETLTFDVASKRTTSTSTYASCTSMSFELPSPTTNVRVIVDMVSTTPTLNILWDDVPTALTYEVYYKVNSTAGTEVFLATVPYSSTLYAFKNYHSVIPSTSPVLFGVRACTTQMTGMSDYKSAATESTLITYPVSPDLSNVIISFDETNMIITWDTPQIAVASYQATWKNSLGMLASMTSVPSASSQNFPSYSIKQVYSSFNANTLVTFKVSATSKSGVQGVAYIIDFLVPRISGAEFDKSLTTTQFVYLTWNALKTNEWGNNYLVTWTTTTGQSGSISSGTFDPVTTSYQIDRINNFGGLAAGTYSIKFYVQIISPAGVPLAKSSVINSYSHTSVG